MANLPTPGSGLALIALACAISSGCGGAAHPRGVLADARAREIPAHAPREAPAEEPARNVLWVVMDDVGLDYLGAYGLNESVPRTPIIDSLARNGVRFDHAYGYPSCTPSRALVLTGRWGYRTGTGTILSGESSFHVPAEGALPSLVEQAAGMFGKWHLGNFVSMGAPAPDAYGYDSYRCSERNLVKRECYTSFAKSEDGVLGTETTYATTDTVDDAIAWISAQRALGRPWLANVSFHAAHIPLHDPPADLVQGAEPCAGDPRCRFMAMIEAMDSELGRLIDFAGLDRTTVIVMGDNGTGELIQAPFPAGRGKGTLYEGSVRVPLIVAGEQVTAPGVDDNLWSLVDLYATIQELCAGKVLVANDSLSMVPRLHGDTRPLRDHVLAESFAPLGALHPDAYRRHTWMVRNARYKLIRDERGDRDELYDLQLDPYESTDLLARELSAEERREYADLAALLDRHTPL